MGRFAWQDRVRIAGARLLVATLLVLHAGAVDAARVAVFDAPGFVDTTGGPTAESDTLQASLASFGHEVVRFSATRAAGIEAALAGAAAVVYPELENGDLAAVLGDGARAVLADFVAAGGGFIIAGTNDERAPALHNAIFGFSLTSGVVGESVITPAAAGTGFEGGPSPLADNLRTRGLDLVSLPTGTLAIYTSGTRATVARMTHGFGRIVYLGWAWYAAAPLGVRDGGWVATLDTAVSDVSECAPAGGGVDSDGDGIPDACDPDAGCADVDGNRTLGPGSRVVAKKEYGSAVPNAVVIAADVFLPVGTTFDELDPLTVPFSIVVRAAGGTARIAETFPLTEFAGGDTAGWRRDIRGNEWTYTDRTGAVTNGFLYVLWKDLSASGPGRVRVEAYGLSGAYPIQLADQPLQLPLTQGDPAAGECGAFKYAENECRASAAGDRITCKR